MPANRVVLAAIDEGGLKHDEPHVAGRGGTLKPLRPKPIVEVESVKPVVEPEVFGKPRVIDEAPEEQFPFVQEDPSPVESTTAESTPTEPAAEAQTQSAEVASEVIETQVKKRKVKKSWEDL